MAQYEQERREFDRARGQDEYLDHVEAATLAFAKEFGVDPSTAAEVIDEIELRTDDWLRLQHQAEDGDLEWSEAKAGQKTIEAEGRGQLVQILGEDLYGELERRVWGKKE